MNSEETTEEGSVELALENHEELRSRVSDVRPRSTEINSEQTTEERSMEHYCPNSVLQATSYPDADGNIISQVQPDVVTPRGGSNVVRVEPNYGIIGVRVSLGGVQAYIIPVQAAAHLRHSTFGTGSGHINETMSAEASPDFSVRDAVGVELNSDDVRAYIQAQQVAAHFRRSIFGAGSGHINETMSAEASPGFSVRDDVGVELNDDDVQAYIQAQQAAAHFRRSTFGAGSGYITETMSVEASSPGGGDGRLGVEWNDEMLTALRSSAPAMREHDGSQDFLVDEAGGRFLAIHIHPPQQGDQGLVGAARGTQDGPGDLARHALPSVIGGLVPLCFNLLLDDSILKADSSPGYIKAAAAAGLGLVTAFTFLGVASKKRAKAAARVVASASTAAVSIAMVYQVSDNAYIKCVCGIMGCVATLATMAIDW